MEDGKKKKKVCKRAQSNETGNLVQGIAMWSGFNNIECQDMRLKRQIKVRK